MNGLIRAVVCAALVQTAGCADEPTRVPGARNDRVLRTPDGWNVIPHPAYAVGTDTTNGRGGTTAAFIGGSTGGATTFASLLQGLTADTLRGRRVRWSGWVRHTGTTAGALWMRVDGPSHMLAFDNMDNRRLAGTSDWHQVSVVLDVPATALGITFGVLLSGPGELLADDFALEVVGEHVLSTNRLPAPVAIGIDSAALAEFYGRLRNTANLDFEGQPTIDAGSTSWLSTAAVPLATVQPGASFTDLQPLEDMIGAARIVGLGEGTHGTREFFLAKHRMVEFLVSEMGFTHFAIEATWPESNDLNHYVLTGEGDPARLLAGLYFWTWNTQEVLNLIRWMREWNETAPGHRRVQFAGFDMQHPGAAMDTVVAVVSRVDPSSASYVGDRYRCLLPYRNVRGARPPTPHEYAALPAATKEQCRQLLQEVVDLITERQSEYAAAMPAAKYANLRQSARVVQQFEAMAAAGVGGGRVRDQAMAENVSWLLAQTESASRMVLWAHNYHVGDLPGSMGRHLRTEWDVSYVSLGFLYGTGSFNAFGAPGPLSTWFTTLIPDRSLEAAFIATGHPIALFDARTIPSDGMAAELRGPIGMRSIGAAYDADREQSYFTTTFLPEDFDLLVFVKQTAATALLGF